MTAIDYVKGWKVSQYVARREYRHTTAVQYPVFEDGSNWPKAGLSHILRLSRLAPVQIYVGRGISVTVGPETVRPSQIIGRLLAADAMGDGNGAGGTQSMFYHKVS